MLKSLPSIKTLCLLARPFAGLLVLAALFVGNAIFFLVTENNNLLGWSLLAFVFILLGVVVEVTRLERNNLL